MKYAKKSVNIIAPFIDVKYLDEIVKYLHGIYTRIITREHSVPKIAEYVSKLNDTNVNLEVKYFNGIHSKLLIIDDKGMMSPSINLTKEAKNYSNYDSCSIRDDAQSLDSELSIFNSLWRDAQKI